MLSCITISYKSFLCLIIELAVSEIKGAPCTHISSAGCTIFGGVHPVCARFLSYLSMLYIGRVHGAISGCTVLGEVHPVSAQNKSLISDTELVK